MLARSHDAARINEVINHPAVRPYVGDGPDVLDISLALEAEENHAVMGEHGGFILAWSAPNIHEIHTFILPEGRGLWAKHAAHELLDYARSIGDRMVWTKVCETASNVEAYTRRAGLLPTGQVVKSAGNIYKIFSLEFV